MKSFACLFMLLLIAMPCVALSDELVYVDEPILKTTADFQIYNTAEMLRPVGLDVLRPRDNPLNQNAYNIPLILADNLGAARYVYLYTLTISSSCGGSVSAPGEGSFQYDPGAVETITATADLNYHFVSWTGTAVGAGSVADPDSASTTVTMNSNYTLVANFAIDQRTLTTSSSGGGSVSTPGEGSFQYDHGTVESVTATPDLNYHFVNWTGSAVDAGKVGDPYSASTTVTVSADYSLVANFAIDQHTLSTSSSGGGSVSAPGEGSFQYGHGTIESVAATADLNYHFVNWTGSAVDAGKVGDPDSASTTVIMNADYTLMANFAIDQRTLTISSSEGGSVSTPGEGSFQYDHGVSVGVTVDPNFGYVVDKWYLDGSDVQSGGSTYLLNMQADHVLNVTFKLIQYTITPTSGSWGGSIHPYDPVTVDHGQTVQFIANASTGYQVDTWYLDGNVVQEGGDIYLLSNIQSDHTICVTFKQYLYKVVSTAGPNGSVAPDIVYVEPGSGQTFTAHPDLGYSVDKWFVDGFTVQIFGGTYTLWDIQDDHAIHVTFRKSLAYSLDSIDFDDEEEFNTRIVSNNLIDPNLPDGNRIHVERLVGDELDPNGVMLMRNLTDLDPTSPNYGKTIRARAKGLFLKTSSDEIMIRFKYKFNSSLPGVGLIIYLSDSVELLDPNDPNRPEHYLEVARLPAPPFPRPGSAGSGRFGIFEKIVWTGHLNFAEEVCVELELVGPGSNDLLFAGSPGIRTTSVGSTSAVVDSLSPAVQCYGICLDINWDNFVDEADFMMVIGECGSSAVGDVACMDGVFSSEGYMDTYDVASWDWALHSDDRLLNYCKIPLIGEGVTVMRAAVPTLKDSDTPVILADLQDDLSDLLIVGKSGESNVHSKLRDRFYIFDKDGLCHGWLEDALERCNIKLVQGPEGEVYLLNTERGLIRLGNMDDAVVPAGKVVLNDINEPRYNRSATVYIGIQEEGSDTFGRPILDAAFDVNYVYVVPVVVDPDGDEPYTATAKLRLLDEGNPPYEIVQLYDEAPLQNDNQYRNYLREIELDNAGNLYVLNVHCLNESDILWRYDPNGTMERLDLGRPDSNSYLPAPIGMYVSKTTNKLYLTSSESNQDDTDSTVLYVFSTQDVLTLEKTITIDGIQHVTGITEDPATKSLWVVGFNMINVPQYPNPYQPAFYYPYLAKVSSGGNDVQIISLYDSDLHDLALPMSIVWTGTTDNSLD